VRWPAPARFQNASARPASRSKGHKPGETEELEILEGEVDGLKGVDGFNIRLLDVHLGPDSRAIAQHLFSALRELDRRGADVILIEGVADADDIAAAVMNRLRKAASEVRS